ncbi:transcription factor (snd1 p100) [Lasallia pustulata]|uniref:Probable endonuclease LCL3 n=1 Tax=Lasallia pustulata TaxID=136370 RepID=A0A1W5CVH2_9LECA|nr:transcription factor (snd1 p100) [Lasallia pustulata]
MIPKGKGKTGWNKAPHRQSNAITQSHTAGNHGRRVDSRTPGSALNIIHSSTPTAEAKNADMPISQAKVKSVLSGDTLVLTSVHNPAQERILSLAFVSAPRIRREGDEPFAFESRDFLRRMAVGKVIQFQVLYNIPTGVKRDYGTLTLQTGQTLPEAAVSEGWVKLRDDAGRKDESEESKSLLDKLELEEAKAKADSKGVWATSGGKLDTAYEVPDPKAFAEEWKGKSLDAIVERVLSGDRMLVRLFVSPTKHVQTMVLVAGIRTPTTKRTNPSDGKEQAADPYGEEAHQFVETRLLQRNVKVDVLGVSPQGQLVGSVIHPNGSIAGFLLKAGLARCTDFHSTMLGDEMATLRQAEKHAKDNKLGLFKGHVTAKGSSSGDAEATVTRVQTADTVYLRDRSAGEKRVSLSSIRQPKPTDPKQAPFQADAKEFLRKQLIGKHVRVTVDGKKAASEGYEEREVVTLTRNNKNVALMLVEAGYASVIRHRRDDDDRSPHYDELLAAEQAAQKDEKGMWSPKPPAVKTYVDYSESLQKAKTQASVLQRQKKIPAIVDFVKSGSRFTVLIPRENAKLTFVLSGIRAPRSARNPTEKAEPFGQEAHDFATRRCMQRDVEIDVENTDKAGGFIGTLYVNRENFAKLLVEEGLASVHAYSAEQSGTATDLFAAEQRAKEAHKGLWHDWNPNAAAAAASAPPTNGTPNGASASSAPRKTDYRDVIRNAVVRAGLGAALLSRRRLELPYSQSWNGLDPELMPGEWDVAGCCVKG